MSVTVRSLGGPARRHERKFVAPWAARHELLARLRLQPARFDAAYAPRHVNSLYFDTPSFRHYAEAVDGVARRRKLRIRWYGDLLGHVTAPHVEVKCKSDQVGWKLVAPLPERELKSGVTGWELGEWLGAPRSRAAHEHALEPVLLNRYRREYWVSRDGRFRVTLDTELAYHRVVRLRNVFGLAVPGPRCLVVELKYAVGDAADAAPVAAGLGLRVGRYSKYALGIERLYGPLACVVAE